MVIRQRVCPSRSPVRSRSRSRSVDGSVPQLSYKWWTKMIFVRPARKWVGGGVSQPPETKVRNMSRLTENLVSDYAQSCPTSLKLLGPSNGAYVASAFRTIPPTHPPPSKNGTLVCLFWGGVFQFFVLCLNAIRAAIAPVLDWLPLASTSFVGKRKSS